MLIGRLTTFATKQVRDDADVLNTAIETAIEQSEPQRTSVIIGEDINLDNKFK